MTKAFDREITRFKNWAQSQHSKYGEWECDYEHWNDILLATKEMMAKYAHRLPDNEQTKDLLYVIARDNEDERLREELVKYPELLRHLSIYGVNSSEQDAKWQIVLSVAEANLPDAKDLIHPYLSDSDEYVRRRSLMAIVPFAPKEAEQIAKFWMEEEYEYSRIAALHVLDMVNSETIEYYLERHKHDPSEYVRSNVEEIYSCRPKA